MCIRDSNQYEISAYAKPDKQSRHNMNYWKFGDYLAIGAGAHVKITQPDGQAFRYRKVRQPNHYLDTNRLSTTAAIETIESTALPLEFLMNTLRLPHGFHQDLFEQTTGQPFSIIEKSINETVKEGLLERENKVIRPTIKGRMYLNELLERFLD